MDSAIVVRSHRGERSLPKQTEQRRGHRYLRNRQSQGIPSIISIEGESITLITLMGDHQWRKALSSGT